MHIHLTGHVIALEQYLSSNSEGLWCLAGLGCFHLLGPATVTQDLLGIVSLLMAIVNDTWGRIWNGSTPLSCRKQEFPLAGNELLRTMVYHTVFLEVCFICTAACTSWRELTTNRIRTYIQCLWLILLDCTDERSICFQKPPEPEPKNRKQSNIDTYAMICFTQTFTQHLGIC